MPLTIGERLGPYEVLALIGEGGMGEVYKARDTRLDRIVALKVSKSEFSERFKREARAVAAVNHPHICTLHDIGTSPDGFDYLVMEFVEGARLKGPLPLDKVQEYAIQIAGALDAAHTKKITHRDLKSANILVSKSAGVKLLDFGLAKIDKPAMEQDKTLTMSMTVKGQILGTLLYMSPEQLNGQEAGPQSDIFSFGVVLYEMLTGKLAFDGSTAENVITAILLRPTPSIADVAPPALDHVLKRCLEKAPENRWQSGRELKAALELAAAIPLVAPAPEAPQTVRRASIGRTLRPMWLGLAAVLLIILALASFRAIRRTQGSGSSVRSLAVLPFTDGSGDMQSNDLTDGFTESMINSLARIRDLTVMSRSSVFGLKSKGRDPIEQGRKLNVDAVLTGSLRQVSDRIEIGLELIDCASGRHLWGKRYSHELADLPTFQRRVVEETAAELRSKQDATENRRIARNYTDDVDAYRFYLKGRFEWNKRTTAGYDAAIGYFKQALEKDPSYALAYSGIADAYVGLSGSRPAAEIFPLARAAAVKALQLDDDLAEAHASLGFINVQYDWDWPGAQRELERALERNPSYPTAHSLFARLWSAQGRFAEAEREAARAQQLDPLSIGIANNVGTVRYLARDYPRAETQFRNNLLLNPNSAATRSFLAYTLVAEGRVADAVSAYEQILSGNPKDGETMADLIRSYALLHRTREAEAVYQRLEQMAKKTYVIPTSLAEASLALGRTDMAFSYLDRAFDERCWYLIFLKVEPEWDAIRPDPRFRALLKKMNLEGPF